MIRVFLCWVFYHTWLQIQLECGTWYHNPRRLQFSSAEIWEFSKSQRDIFDAITISKIIVFEIIFNFAYYSAVESTFPIEQASNKATKCSIGRSWSQYLQSYGRLSAKVTQ